MCVCEMVALIIQVIFCATVMAVMVVMAVMAVWVCVCAWLRVLCEVHARLLLQNMWQWQCYNVMKFTSAGEINGIVISLWVFSTMAYVYYSMQRWWLANNTHLTWRNGKSGSSFSCHQMGNLGNSFWGEMAGGG